MNEKVSSQKRPNFLGLGLFPEDVPPNFSSINFATLCGSEFFKKYQPKGHFIHPAGERKIVRTQLVRYNASKRGRNRREFSIPNPISYHDTCLFLDKHWQEIAQFIDLAKNSYSKPEYDGELRAIKITKHSEMPSVKLLKLGGYKYVLQTDISRFYHTIYTHSLPWAFHGKKVSKSETSPNSAKIFFNKIDEIIRNGQDGQTIGIPVGTDTSRVLAEVVSTAIDLDFSKQNPKIQFMRHVDDIWFGARSDDEAEQILSSYRFCLRKFELDINDLKTGIRPFSVIVNEKWPHILKSYVEAILEKKTSERKTEAFIQFYSYAFGEANSLQDEGIIKYAIKLLDTNELWDEEKIWPLLEKFLASCVLNYPHSIDYVAQVISWRYRKTSELDVGLWRQVFNDVVLEHAPRLDDHEVSWALWTLKEIGQKLLKRPLEAVLNFSGDIPLILAFHLIQKKLVSSKFDFTAIVSRRMDTKSSLSEHWLFLHEANLNGWLKPHKFDYDHSFLRRLRARRISFFDDLAKPLAFQEMELEHPVKVGDIHPATALPQKNTGYDDIDAGWEDEEEFEAFSFLDGDDELPF